MTDPVRQTAALAPSPRHLRRRRFRGEISPARMVGYQPEERAHTTSSMPGKQTVDLPPVIGPTASSNGREMASTRSREITLRQKRQIALLVVILVSVSIPVLALTLMFAR